MHGSTEYPAFVLDLAKNLATPGQKLAVGFEIPVNEQALVSEAVASKDPFVLLRSQFFQGAFQDGRESTAMALLIAALGEIDGVEVFCFDKDNRVNAEDRDLEMAKNVAHYVKDSGATQTILLAGNLHTRLIKGSPFDPNFVPMGFYLPRVEGSTISEPRMLSMLGRIEGGSYWASFSSNADECGVKRAPAAPSNYSRARTAQRYVLVEPDLQDGHNAAVFVRSLSASLPWKLEGPNLQQCTISSQALDLFVEQAFWTFDQTPFGHRSLFRPPTYCKAASSSLIDTYLLSRIGTVSASEKRILYFHAGQDHAFAEATQTAVARFRESLNPEEPANPDFHWNAYVTATMAFLNRDRATLENARRLFPGDPDGGDRVNVRIVDRFIRCFESSYWDAYGNSGSCADNHQASTRIKARTKFRYSPVESSDGRD